MERVFPLAVIRKLREIKTMINGMKYSGDWSGLFASVIIVFIPTFVLYIGLSKKIIGGITGGVKG